MIHILTPEQFLEKKLDDIKPVQIVGKKKKYKKKKKRKLATTYCPPTGYIGKGRGLGKPIG